MFFQRSLNVTVMRRPPTLTSIPSSLLTWCPSRRSWTWRTSPATGHGEIQDPAKYMADVFCWSSRIIRIKASIGCMRDSWNERDVISSTLLELLQLWQRSVHLWLYSSVREFLPSQMIFGRIQTLVCTGRTNPTTARFYFHLTSLNELNSRTNVCHFNREKRQSAAKNEKLLCECFVLHFANKKDRGKLFVSSYSKSVYFANQGARTQNPVTFHIHFSLTYEVKCCTAGWRKGEQLWHISRLMRTKRSRVQ